MAGGAPSRVPCFYGGGLVVQAEDKLDPLIKGLLSRLPEADQTWETEKRLRWLQTLAPKRRSSVSSTRRGRRIVAETAPLDPKRTYNLRILSPNGSVERIPIDALQFLALCRLIRDVPEQGCCCPR